MKYTISLFLFLTLLATAREPEEVELKRLEALRKTEIGTLSAGTVISHGDYMSGGITILIQKLPDGRYLISENDFMPTAKRFATKKDVLAIRDKLVEFHATVLREKSLQEEVDEMHDKDKKEWLRLKEKHFPHGYTYTEMKITFRDSEGTWNLTTNFNDKADTLLRYNAYLKSLISPEKPK